MSFGLRASGVLGGSMDEADIERRPNPETTPCQGFNVRDGGDPTIPPHESL